MSSASHPIAPAQARALWIRAQRLDVASPFGQGAQATRLAVEHLGYVQIDTINVIERCHHHILFTRIPAYVRSDLEQVQSDEKSVFEYWTHALAYVGAADYRFFVATMDRYRTEPRPWAADVDAGEYAGLLKRIRDEGPLSIRDFDDDIPVEKTHPWGSRKPSRNALRYGFFVGDLAVSRRSGMVKTFDLSRRHFGWTRRPRPASPDQVEAYLLQRALRSQGIVSLESICYGNAAAKPGVAGLIEAAVRRKRLVPCHIEGLSRVQHWAQPSALAGVAGPVAGPVVHILSPFDPLVIQRKRLAAFFGYAHRFEAYVPLARRVLGYFALPILVGDEVVAAIDLKTDRQAGRLLVQRWTWLAEERAELRAAIEAALTRFEAFQLH